MTTTNLGLSSIGSAAGEVTRLANLGADFQSCLDEMKETSVFYDQMIKAFEGNTFNLKVTISVTAYGSESLSIHDSNASDEILRVLKAYCEKSISEFRDDINRTAKEMVNE